MPEVNNRTDKEKFEAEHRKLKRGHPSLRKKPSGKGPIVVHYIEMHCGYNIRYLCNMAVKPTKGKFTKDLDKVTCKNCLQKIGGWK